MHQILDLVASSKPAIDKTKFGGNVGIGDVTKEVEGVGPLLIWARE